MVKTTLQYTETYAEFSVHGVFIRTGIVSKNTETLKTDTLRSQGTRTEKNFPGNAFQTDAVKNNQSPLRLPA